MRRIPLPLPLPRRLAILALAPLLALSATAATAQGVWVTVPNMPTARSFLATASAHCPEGLRGKCVYAVGGQVGSDAPVAVNKFEAYSPAAGTWATLPPLKTARTNLAATTAPCPDGVKGDCVYAIGGSTLTGSPLTTVEAYSTETNAWLTLKSMPTRRQLLAAATAPCPDGLGLRGTCVYAFGGADAATLSTVEAYSPATDTWATLPTLQTARNGHGGAAAPCPGALGLRGTCVYAISGSGDLTSVEVYSPVLNAWQYAAEIPTPRNNFGTAAAPCPDGLSDGCVYTVGGGTFVEDLIVVEAYTPVTNAWVTLPTLPTGRFGLSSAAAHCPKNKHRDCVYAVGGFAGAPTGITETFAIEPGPAAPSKPKPKPKPEQKPDTKPSGPPAEGGAQEPDWSKAPEADPAAR
ncbi:Kelch repeat-containing protein [Streptomyces sp. WM6368]|uniref:Kelch repeat-containing protein n=1 Tax=Streptomyces sp. WM6368 TaxID=1415554 RepID=UPI0006AE0A90|nr:kelch repeat-containing protein [Streptomyces sp. WM6368]KOU16259.1 hypothetical protein ADK51_31880 [Streptomyces sp. WM6368]